MRSGSVLDFPARILGGGKTSVHIILIALLGILAYSNTFDVPFQWDENDLIAENPLIKSLEHFLKPQTGILRMRYAGYLTFALNYKVHGLDVTGYHVVNLAIHILNAFLVYFLVRLTLKTPELSSLRGTKSRSNLLALFTALLFVSHPIQTEAVTYIFQRLASLAAFFYLLSLVFYIKWRLGFQENLKSQISNFKSPFYLLSLLWAVLAMKTKENAFTLPVAIMLYEFLFFSGPVKRRAAGLIPHFLTMLIIPFSLIRADGSIEGITASIGSLTHSRGTPPADYLFTQMRVVVSYIRLLIFPAGQSIYHSYPVYGSFFMPGAFLSFSLLLFIFSLGVFFIFRSRKGSRGLRVIAFGIFWFFTTLSVESGLIPLPMVMSEYRAYLPSVGFFMAFGAGAFLLYGRLKSRSMQVFLIACLALLPVVSASAAYLRNSVWQSRITLWEDVVKKAPMSADALYNLAAAYRDSGKPDEAIRHFHAAISLKPDFTESYAGIAVIYRENGLYDEAVKYFLAALSRMPDDPALHYNIGLAYKGKGMMDKAIEHFRIALGFRPDAEAHKRLGILYMEAGIKDKAAMEFQMAIKMNPGDAELKEILRMLNP